MHNANWMKRIWYQMKEWKKWHKLWKFGNYLSSGFPENDKIVIFVSKMCEKLETWSDTSHGSHGHRTNLRLPSWKSLSKMPEVDITHDLIGFGDLMIFTRFESSEWHIGGWTMRKYPRHFRDFGNLAILKYWSKNYKSHTIRSALKNN